MINRFMLFMFVVGALTKAQAGCLPPKKGEVFQNRNDTLAKSLLELGKNYQSVYQSPQRLKGRAFWNPSSKSYQLPTHQGRLVTLQKSFINTLSSHLKQALDHRYASYLYYPDMGHVHLLLPKEKAKGKKLEYILTHPELTFLYHTGELLEFKTGSPLSGKLKDDDELRWRYYSRNFMASHQTSHQTKVIYAKGQKYNTVRKLPGYQEVQKLYFSANRKGCFSLQHKGAPLFFDLTLMVGSSKTDIRDSVNK